MLSDGEVSLLESEGHELNSLQPGRVRKQTKGTAFVLTNNRACTQDKPTSFFLLIHAEQSHPNNVSTQISPSKLTMHALVDAHTKQQQLQKLVHQRKELTGEAPTKKQ